MLIPAQGSIVSTTEQANKRNGMNLLSGSVTVETATQQAPVRSTGTLEKQDVKDICWDAWYQNTAGVRYGRGASTRGHPA